MEDLNGKLPFTLKNGTIGKPVFSSLPLALIHDSCLKVLEPILSKLDGSCFDVLDRKLVWSSKRPVWFQVC
jgi:hypothetical protein